MAHILIVDDDELIRITLHTILERAGYETTMATNGQDGLAKFRACPADLVILDMILPEKGGIEALIEFRQAQPDVKIIAISGGVWGIGAPHTGLICLTGPRGRCAQALNPRKEGRIPHY